MWLWGIGGVVVDVTEVPGVKPVAVQFHLSQVRRGLARDQFWALTMRSRRLTAWTMSRPIFAIFLTRSFASVIQHLWWMNEYEPLVKWHWKGKRGLEGNLSHCHCYPPPPSSCSPPPSPSCSSSTSPSSLSPPPSSSYSSIGGTSVGRTWRSPATASIRVMYLWKHAILKVFLSNATTCPCGLRGPPFWAWQECNRLLRLGRPWGAVTLSRWCEWWYRKM